MNEVLFSGISLDDDEISRIEWYSIWSVGIPKKGNPHNWFLYHAKKDGDFLSVSYILHEICELEMLEKMKCSPFDIDSIALKRLAKRDGIDDPRVYVDSLNSIHPILLNQKVAQASMGYEHERAHEAGLVKQIEYIREYAYKKGYDVTKGALASTLPFARDRGEFVEIEEDVCGNRFLKPNNEEIKVAKQFWNIVNEEVPFNLLNRSYPKNFPNVVNPSIRNIYDFLVE